MAKQLSDKRKRQRMTEADADALFRELALVETRLLAKTAAVEKKIGELKTTLATEIAEDNMLLDSLREQLTDYIEANPDRFTSPRQRKTDFGKYGLYTTSKIVISDEDAMVAFSDSEGLNLYKLVLTPIKKRVRDAICAGYEVPGAQLLNNVHATFNVDRQAVESYLQRQLQERLQMLYAVVHREDVHN